MSRIGRAPVKLASGVEVKAENGVITVKGPLGTLTQDYDASVIGVNVENGEVLVTRANEENATKAKHGLYRALIHNMVVGVTNGYQKTLVVNGVGWKVAMNGKDVTMSIGFSHPVEFKAVEGITLSCPSATEITVKGINKELVGEPLRSEPSESPNLTTDTVFVTATKLSNVRKARLRVSKE